jgi:hypothetical protein
MTLYIGRGTSSYASVIRPDRNKKRPSLRLLKSPMIRSTDNTRNDEKELITEWPTSGGGTTKVSSTTMTSAFMKDVRGHLEKEFGSK